MSDRVKVIEFEFDPADLGHDLDVSLFDFDPRNITEGDSLYLIEVDGRDLTVEDTLSSALRRADEERAHLGVTAVDTRNAFQKRAAEATVRG
jgi:hypothetical protein